MTQNKMSGNKGEWSELYAFFKLLSEGRVFAADSEAKQIDDVFYPITKIMREETKGEPIEYVIDRETKSVQLHFDGKVIDSVRQDILADKASLLYYEIQEGKSSFEIDQIATFANGLMIHKIKAPSSDKTDISMQIEDTFTNTKQDVGFSIKSDLGNAPTLLNASKATNFVYAVRGLNEDDIKAINAIDSRSKIRDRMGAIYAARGSFVFKEPANTVFDDNLILIDSLLPEIIADLLLVSYSRDIFSLQELVDILEQENPRGYRRKDAYAYKVRKLLCACALGMKPSQTWDGSEEANGGYILVTKSGEVLAYHIYNREAFELYLLSNTVLERASTGRHEYMSLYEENGETRINLNLQIRFKGLS